MVFISIIESGWSEGDSSGIAFNCLITLSHLPYKHIGMPFKRLIE